MKAKLLSLRNCPTYSRNGGENMWATIKGCHNNLRGESRAKKQQIPRCARDDKSSRVEIRVPATTLEQKRDGVLVGTPLYRSIFRIADWVGVMGHLGRNYIWNGMRGLRRK